MRITVLSGFALALFAPVIHRFTKGFTSWLMALLIYFAGYLGAIAEGEIIREANTWTPTFGISLPFVINGLSLLMILIITDIGGLIFIFGVRVKLVQTKQKPANVLAFVRIGS